MAAKRPEQILVVDDEAELTSVLCETLAEKGFETTAANSGPAGLEILSGGSVVRSFASVPQHSQIYTAAEQAADFPSGLPNPLIVRVCQRSSVVGRGRLKTESLYVR